MAHLRVLIDSLDSQWAAYSINPLIHAGDVREEEFGWCLISWGLSGGCRSGSGSEVPLHYSVRVTVGLEHPL